MQTSRLAHGIGSFRLELLQGLRPADSALDRVVFDTAGFGFSCRWACRANFNFAVLTWLAAIGDLLQQIRRRLGRGSDGLGRIAFVIPTTAFPRQPWCIPRRLYGFNDRRHGYYHSQPARPHPARFPRITGFLWSLARFALD